MAAAPEVQSSLPPLVPYPLVIASPATSQLSLSPRPQVNSHNLTQKKLPLPLPRHLYCDISYYHCDTFRDLFSHNSILTASPSYFVHPQCLASTILSHPFSPISFSKKFSEIEPPRVILFTSSTLTSLHIKQSRQSVILTTSPCRNRCHRSSPPNKNAPTQA